MNTRVISSFRIINLSLILGLFLNSCGRTGSSSGSSTELSGVSVASIPSAKSMVKTNSASQSYSLETSNSPSFSNNVKAVSGTPPILTAISDSNVDQHFWKGLIASLGNGQPTQQQQSEFWGNTVGGAGGMGACQMAQGTGESFSNLISSGGTLCYMKGISAATITGITVDSGSAVTVFNAAAEDKVIKIAIQNMTSEGDGHGPSTVYFKIYGTNTTGNSVYKADLWMCAANGSVNQVETITINKETGSFTDMTVDSRGSESSGSNTLTASLVPDGNGGFIFDATKDRHFTGIYSGTHQGQTFLYKGDLTINSLNQIISKVYRYNSGDYGEHTDRVYSIASFSGSSFADLRFLAAGFKGYSTNVYNSQNYSHDYEGGIEYQDTHYVSVNSDLRTDANQMDFAVDSFYLTDLTPPTLSTTHTCDEAPDVNVTMDFSAPAVKAIQDTCDGDRYSNYNMCYGATVQAAQQKMWGSPN